jgi:hypothetical protein
MRIIFGLKNEVECMRGLVLVAWLLYLAFLPQNILAQEPSVLPTPPPVGAVGSGNSINSSSPTFDDLKNYLRNLNLQNAAQSALLLDNPENADPEYKIGLIFKYYATKFDGYSDCKVKVFGKSVRFEITFLEASTALKNPRVFQLRVLKNAG